MDTENKKSREPQEQPNNPLHGIKLADILDYLVAEFGWEELGTRTSIHAFESNPTVKSSLKFLRRTPWARDKVEYLYFRSIKNNLPPKFNQKPLNKISPKLTF